MHDPGFGLVMEDTGADYLMGTGDCNLYTVGDLQDRHFAFGFKKSETRGGTSHTYLIM